MNPTPTITTTSKTAEKTTTADAAPQKQSVGAKNLSAYEIIGNARKEAFRGGFAGKKDFILNRTTDTDNFRCFVSLFFVSFCFFNKQLYN